LAEGIVADVNAMTLDEQKQLLQHVAPEVQRKAVTTKVKQILTLLSQSS